MENLKKALPLAEEDIKNIFWDFREKMNVITDNKYFDLPKVDRNHTSKAEKNDNKSKMSRLEWFESKYSLFILFRIKSNKIHT